jgi:hypothetical protein
MYINTRIAQSVVFVDDEWNAITRNLDVDFDTISRICSGNNRRKGISWLARIMQSTVSKMHSGFDVKHGVTIREKP